MTRSITPITAAGKSGDNGPRTEEKAGPEHGLFVLRGREGRGLISLACDALGETFNLAARSGEEFVPYAGRNVGPVCVCGDNLRGGRGAWCHVQASCRP